MPKNDEAAKQLKKRTIRALCNAKPAWLETAQRRIDVAVIAAYGWPADISDDEQLTKLLELNLTRPGLEMEDDAEPDHEEDDDEEDADDDEAR